MNPAVQTYLRSRWGLPWSSPRSGAPSDGKATAGALPGGSDPRAVIRELHKHPAYLDKRHPEHAAIVARMGELYRAAFPGAPGRVIDVPPPPRPDDPRAKIRELERDPAYGNKLDPRHGEVVAQMGELYRAAFPEPAPIDVPAKP